MLQAEQLTKSLGERVLFRALTIGINQGQRIALVGPNGCGKSTLLKMLAGIELPDEGLVSRQKGLRWGYLPQNPQFNPEHTIEQALFASKDPQLAAIRDYELALEWAHNKPGADAQQMVEKAMEQLLALNAWEAEHRIRQILGKLAIYNLRQKMGGLSGGQIRRVALAQTLVHQPDLLLLDEPTNHLDVEMIEWLEIHLRAHYSTLLMVSHDRYFLDAVCNEIVELEQGGALQHYKGNYAYFLENKALRDQMKQSQVDKAKNTYYRELEWMRRQPKARGTKSKARIDQFYETKEVAFSQRKADALELDIKINRLGGKIIELIKVSKQYNGFQIIKPFTYTFKAGEKIGLVGPNGSGKSTLLNILAGLEKSDSGKVVHGETIEIGYFTQQAPDFGAGKRIIEVVKDVAEYIPLAKGRTLTASQLLQRFLFPPAVQYGMVEKLSGGEKKRLQLLRVLMKNPNFLILDEPTNDLDLQTLNILHNFLEDYPGCLLIVTHDRYFMDTLVDHLFVFDGKGNIRDYNGNYTDYREQLTEGDRTEKWNREKPEKDKAVERTSSGKTKVSFKDKFEFEQLEKEIPALELRLRELNIDLTSQNLPHDEIIKKTEELSQISQILEAKTLRWLEISLMMEGN